jgi:hypothetical protein
MGRPSKLADPEFLKLICEAFAAGCSRGEMAKEFSVAKSTLTVWRRDPRVRALTLKLIEDRVVRITSKIDSEISARLQFPDEIETETLIKIRKEYLGGALRIAAEGKVADSETVNEAMMEIESNPERLAELTELLSNSTKKS